MQKGDDAARNPESQSDMFVFFGGTGVRQLVVLRRPLQSNEAARPHQYKKKSYFVTGTSQVIVQKSTLFQGFGLSMIR